MQVLVEMFFWILVVDDTTGYKWSVFVKNKDMIGEAVITLVKSDKKLSTKLRYLHMDNSSENELIIQELKNSGIKNVKYKFTAPNTPQKNGVVERFFQEYTPVLGQRYTLWMRNRELGPASGPSVHQP